MNASDRKFRILTRILDHYVKLGASAPKACSVYKKLKTVEARDQARSRALIHLYLEATYGCGKFEDREKLITEGSNDGGIDAYYIDEERRTIDVIQSKFRSNSTNFQKKFIEPTELAKIDIDRILKGYDCHENGVKYNGHVIGLQRRMSDIKDIARYSHQLTVLANTPEENWSVLQRMFSDYELNVVGSERCYRELVLPVLRGEQFYGKTLRLQLDLSNKSAASKLSAEISTKFGPCEITVVLVPTLEIAQLMSRYKNSILRYNPRSYLEFREQRTNEAIRSSIVLKDTGEFAILNNGITILSDDTYMSERVGSRNKASVEIVNPQIINGGQTAFTLSRIFDEATLEDRQTLFSEKEVLVRIITIPELEEEKRSELINEISSATNSQTQVSNVDRTASNELNREIAEHIFLTTGLLYEPRRGEYSNAIYTNYIDRIEVLERSLFTRLIFIAEGKYSIGVKKKMMRHTGGILPKIPDKQQLSDLADLYSIFVELIGESALNSGSRLTYTLAMSVLGLKLLKDSPDISSIEQASLEAKSAWTSLMNWGMENKPQYTKIAWNPRTSESQIKFQENSWLLSGDFPNDIDSFLGYRATQSSTEAAEPQLPLVS